MTAVAHDTAAAHRDLRPHATDSTDTDEILARARERGVRDGLPYAGSVSPGEAWLLFSRDAAQLVDVRTAEERKFVGHVPGTLHVPWMTGTSLTRNPRFVRELEARAGKKDAVLLLCRSGKRSADAAAAAARLGFASVFNVAEGFEGELDEQGRRGLLGGWRFHGLPWVQD